MQAAVLLEIRHIEKRFGGLTALADVSLTINHREIYGLIGPNGAGKTTLFNVLTGLYVPDRGQFEFDGANLVGLKPYRVAESGIARTFQNIRLFGNMTAIENVMVGRHVRTHAGAIGAILRTRHARDEEVAIRRGPGSCSAMSGSASMPACCPGTSPTAISAGWKSRARLPRNRSCWRSTSRRPE